MLRGIPPGTRRAVGPFVYAVGIAATAIVSIGMWALSQMIELMEESA